MIKRRTLLKTGVAVTAVSCLPSGLFAQTARPERIFDCHGHFYTNDVENYPFDAHTARYGPERMVAKAMANPMTAEVVQAFWDRAGIEKGLGVQYSSTYFTDNSYLLDSAAKYPDRIIPIVILDALAAETPAALARMAEENHIAGVRFMGGANEDGQFPYMTDQALPSWEMCNDLGLTITLMPLGGAPGAALPRVQELAGRYSNVKVVLDHIGFPGYARSPETFGYTPEHLALAGTENLFYKYTTFLIEMLVADNTPMRDFCDYTVETFSADHMIWGSDIGNSEVDELEYVDIAIDSTANLTTEQRNAIFYDTAQELFIPGGRGAA